MGLVEGTSRRRTMYKTADSETNTILASIGSTMFHIIRMAELTKTNASTIRASCRSLITCINKVVQGEIHTIYSMNTTHGF